MSLAKICFIFVCLMGLAAHASLDQDVYFKLHQAIAYLEAYSSKKCPLGANYSDKFLKGLNPKSVGRFQEELDEFLKLRDMADKVTLLQFERFRFNLHEKATELGLTHSGQWHNDAASCKKVADE